MQPDKFSSYSSSHPIIFLLNLASFAMQFLTALFPQDPQALPWQLGWSPSSIFSVSPPRPFTKYATPGTLFKAGTSGTFLVLDTLFQCVFGVDANLGYVSTGNIPSELYITVLTYEKLLQISYDVGRFSLSFSLRAEE